MVAVHPKRYGAFIGRSEWLGDDIDIDDDPAGPGVVNTPKPFFDEFEMICSNLVAAVADLVSSRMELSVLGRNSYVVAEEARQHPPIKRTPGVVAAVFREWSLWAGNRGDNNSQMLMDCSTVG
ncbi:MAG: hypothetical protein P4L98_16795 [Ancalomicrobiaceae bacterium]|nr:hypothetical protein [Ancalomicrobiaceae bacterium]